MKQKKIVIAGGSGFIGQALCNYFGKEYTLVILSRQIPNQQTNAYGKRQIEQQILGNIHFVTWDGATIGPWAQELDGADMLINLTGKTVNCRYTRKNKQEIIDSRVHATKILGQAIQASAHPPLLWINAASATIYPHATDESRDESFRDFSDDFSVKVCQLWEKAFFDRHTPSTRKIALRMAITLGAGCVMMPYFNLLKFGLGGRQGNGKQMYTWIHILDTCRMIEWINNHPEIEGIYNCCSPNAVTNSNFMEILRKATGKKIGLPAYTWILKLGAFIIGTEPELVLKSRWVLPTKIMATGFKFSLGCLPQAMDDIVSKTPPHNYRLLAGK
jgi:uncharacterized protein (TIGR01777 family)